MRQKLDRNATVIISGTEKNTELLSNG